jgi:hypothetical protein
MTFVSKQRTLCALGVFVFAFSAAAQAQTIERDIPWQSFQDWNVFQSSVYKGCVATASYQNGTTVRLGFDGIIKGYFVNFSNHKWSDYEMMKNIELEFVLDGSRSFRGYFHTIQRDRMATFETGGIKMAFLDGLAAANSFRIREGRTQLAALSLSGSRRALNSMMECERARNGQ